MREGRLSRFSVETSLSHRTKAVPRGKFLRLTIFLVSEKNIDKRGSRYHDFPSKLFSLIVPNHLVDEPSVLQELSGIENYWGKRKGGCHDFPSKHFCLTETKQFVGETFCGSLCFWYRKKNDRRGSGYHDFPTKKFYLLVPNHFADEPFCVSENFGYRKIIW